MKKFFLAFVLSMGCLGGSVIAEESGNCLSPMSAESKQSLLSDGQVAQQVLCCCQTRNGQCCKYVGFCGGFIPGCLCSGNAPEINENSDGTNGSELKRTS